MTKEPTPQHPSLDPAIQIRSAFERYKWLAWVAGTVLAFNVVVALPYKYVLHGESGWTEPAWMLHGWVYLVYFIVTLDFGLKSKWGYGKLFLMELAGTIPFMSFVAEKRARQELGL